MKINKNPAFMKYLAWLTGLTKKRSRQGLYEFLAMQYSDIPIQAKVLSVGSGGEINELLISKTASKSISITTIDIDEARLPDIVADICEVDLPANTYDVVVISEVLEHLHSPHKGISNIHNTLKHGGKLILTTPFILPMHDRPHDYFRFTKHGIEMLLRNFQNIQILERNSYYEAIDVLWLRLLQSQKREAVMASLIIIPIIFFIKRPFTVLLSKLFDTDAMTTGYVSTAFK